MYVFSIPLQERVVQKRWGPFAGHFEACASVGRQIYSFLCVKKKKEEKHPSSFVHKNSDNYWLQKTFKTNKLVSDNKLPLKEAVLCITCASCSLCILLNGPTHPPGIFFNLTGLLGLRGIPWSSYVTVSSHKAKLRTFSRSIGDRSLTWVIPNASGIIMKFCHKERES